MMVCRLIMKRYVQQPLKEESPEVHYDSGSAVPGYWNQSRKMLHEKSGPVLQLDEEVLEALPESDAKLLEKKSALPTTKAERDNDDITRRQAVYEIVLPYFPNKILTVNCFSRFVLDMPQLIIT